MSSKILVMAGGSGERFWPLSTKKNPKQLLSLVSSKSMIRETVDRILNMVSINDIYIATNIVQLKGILRELPDLPTENIIIEPCFRDTAAAIAYGSSVIAKDNDNPTIIVLASDHLILNVDGFIKALKVAEQEAKRGYIVTLGIKPTRPETGYGYISLLNNNLGKANKVDKFLEKPNLETATSYFESSRYVWNSGMFIFKYNTMMTEMSKYIPKHFDILNLLKPKILKYSGFELSEQIKDIFLNFERISIDYAIMEKTKFIKCIPVDIGWNDIGGYNSLADVFQKDLHGNVVKDCSYVFIDSQNNIVISDNNDKLVTTIGITDTIIVNSTTGILIVKKTDTNKIKELLKRL